MRQRSAGFRIDFDKSNFLSDVFEKRPCFMRATHEIDYSWGDVNFSLHNRNGAAINMAVHKNGVLSEYEYTRVAQDIDGIEKSVDLAKFHSLLRQGSTAVINRVERSCPFIADICYDLAHFVEERVVANSYMAFSGTGTFGKHWDTHDVFAVQLIGKKRWQVFEPTYLLPLPGQRSKHKKTECPESPIFDEILIPGDVLYIPRGWWHEATPVAGYPTYHIAAGIHTSKTHEYVAWVIEDVMPQYIESRVTVRATAPSQDAVADFMAQLTAAALDAKNIARFSAGIHAMLNREHRFDVENSQLFDQPNERSV